MGAIFVTSSLPDTNSGDLIALLPSTLKNLLHIPAYGLLAVTLCLALPQRRGWRTALLVLVLTLGYGVLDEWHQSFVPGRDVSGADLLRDVLGGSLGIALMRRQWAAKAPTAAGPPPTGDC